MLKFFVLKNVDGQRKLFVPNFLHIPVAVSIFQNLNIEQHGRLRKNLSSTSCQGICPQSPSPLPNQLQERPLVLADMSTMTYWDPEDH